MCGDALPSAQRDMSPCPVLEVHYVSSHSLSLCCGRYMLFYDTKPQLMKIWVPVVFGSVCILVALIEVRVAVGFGQQAASGAPTREWFMGLPE